MTKESAKVIANALGVLGLVAYVAPDNSYGHYHAGAVVTYQVIVTGQQ